MQTVTIALTAGQAAALSLDIVNVEGWIINLAEAKAYSVLHQIKTTPEWASAIGAAAVAQINVHDDDAVLVHAMSLGLLETAEAKELARLAQAEEGEPEPIDPD